jgi:hypothetical protein
LNIDPDTALYDELSRLITPALSASTDQWPETKPVQAPGV